MSPVQSEQFDFIIVGAGSAGCALAARLTENSKFRVCLIEAGGKDSNPLIHIAGIIKVPKAGAGMPYYRILRSHRINNGVVMLITVSMGHFVSMICGA